VKKQIIIWAILILFSVSAVGCATIFHSERVGNSGGRLDIGMCVLGIFFFWPISWIVDLCTGAIWMDGSSGGYRLPDGTPGQFTDAYPFQEGKIVIPVDGKFSFTLPVRGDGVHCINVRLITEDGSIAASDSITFLAEENWKNIKSVMAVRTGYAGDAVLKISADGRAYAEIPVVLVATAN